MTEAKKPAKRAKKTTAIAPATQTHIARTPELIKQIFDRVATGESLVTICKSEGMPCRQTVFDWINDIPEVQQAYSTALASKAEMYAEELISLADNVGSPLLVDGIPLMRNGEPVMIVTSEAVAHAKLMVNTRQWVVSKLLPKKYGDKIDVTSGGEKVDPLMAVIQAVQGSSLPVQTGITVDHEDDD